jgi:hypothetical protein
MRYKTTLLSLGLLLITSGIQAQQTTLATGSNNSGIGGSSSYSIGQIISSTITNSNGSVAQGVQQPYEFSITTGVNRSTINLELFVYPNPTTSILKLKVRNQQFESLSFQLFDMQGKLIENNKLKSTTTTINLEALPKSIYFLNVTDNNQLIKTFKIIKN